MRYPVEFDHLDGGHAAESFEAVRTGIYVVGDSPELPLHASRVILTIVKVEQGVFRSNRRSSVSAAAY